MPKVFKPKINANSSLKQKKTRTTSETPKCISSPGELSPCLKTGNEKKNDVNQPDPSSEQILNLSPTLSCAIQPKLKVEVPQFCVNLPRDTDVDIDASAPEACNDLHTEYPPVKLFTFKQQQRREHVEYGEPPPPIDKPLDRSTVTLRSLLNWVPLNKPPPKIRNHQLNTEPVRSVLQHPQLTEENDNHDAENSKDDVKESQLDPFAPQLRLDADGNIVLDEQSLEVTRPKDTALSQRRFVAEDAGLYGTNYNSFRRRPVNPRGRRWSEKDSTRFYRALSTIGTDFYCMTKLFPNRTRAQLLKKFKREERLFPHLVDDALKNKRDYDITAFDNSDSEPGEKYERLSKVAIEQKRRTPKEKIVTKEVKKHCSCNIDALIEEVLAEGVSKHPISQECDGAVDIVNGSKDNSVVASNSTKLLKRKRATRYSLAHMIDETAKELPTGCIEADKLSPDLTCTRTTSYSSPDL